MTLFLQTMDLASARRAQKGMQGQCTVKAGTGAKNTTAPGSKQEQGTAYPDMAHIQDYVLAITQEFLVQSLKGF